MEIVEISKDKINDIKDLNEPFEIIGKIKPLFVNDEWSYTEELFDDSRWQSYPDEEMIILNMLTARIRQPSWLMLMTYLGENSS